MKHLFTIVFSMLILTVLRAQEPCDDISFLIPKDGEINRTEIVYGSNRGYFNNTLTLRADVYALDTDEEDSSLRPLVVLAHGGGFVFGTRNDMRDLCEAYASLGYVCASIEYRLYPFFLAPFMDSATVVQVAFNAISDMRGAVRHFKRLADEDNPFQIDPNKIIVGGLSAGAIMALHTGYFHEGDFVAPEFFPLLQANGGIEGNTGDSINLTYNSRVQGIISLSGATFDTLWITSDDPPLHSMHGDADDILPFGWAREGAFNRVTLYGSSKIHERADNIGIPNYFVGVPGGGHTDIYSAPQFADFLADFNLNTLLMMRDIACEELVSQITENQKLAIDFKIYPNPSSGSSIWIETTEQVSDWSVQIFDAKGRMVYHRDVLNGSALQIDDFQGGAGWYVVHLRNKGHLQAAKVLVRK